jgi:hypothetical protein
LRIQRLLKKEEKIDNNKEKSRFKSFKNMFSIEIKYLSDFFY